jgi:hypothetical protein
MAAFALAAVLIPVVVRLQARSNDPLLPLRLFQDRNRPGSYVAMLLVSFGPMGAFYLLTLFMQHILGYNPIQTSLAWLPFGVGIVLGAGVASKLVVRVAPRITGPQCPRHLRPVFHQRGRSRIGYRHSSQPPCSRNAPTELTSAVVSTAQGLSRLLTVKGSSLTVEGGGNPGGQESEHGTAFAAAH